MAIDTGLLNLELGSWFFELDESEWKAFEHRSESAEQQHEGETESGQSDQEFLIKRARIGPRGQSRFL